MKIPVGVKIAALTLGATIFYTYVGQLVPQSEVHPPEETVLAADLTPEEMVETGRQIAEGKGLCLTCHTIGQTGALRFPDLAGIGARAADRVPGISGLDYLAQSLYEPDAYIVPGFTGGMPTADRPPLDLTDQEILTVIAWLQSLGGEVTVTMNTRHAWMEGGAPPQTAEAPAAVQTPAPAAEIAAPASDNLLSQFACLDCHGPQAPAASRGPSLEDIGDRLSAGAIRTALLDDRGAHAQAAFRRQATIEEVQRMVLFLTETRSEQ